MDSEIEPAQPALRHRVEDIIGGWVSKVIPGEVEINLVESNAAVPAERRPIPWPSQIIPLL